MSELHIHIHATELSDALTAIAQALQHTHRPVDPPAPPQAPTPATGPVAPPVDPAPTAPVAPVSSGPTITKDALRIAISGLIDSAPGAQDAVLGLFRQYDIQSINDLPDDRIGAFATAIRGMGARV